MAHIHYHIERPGPRSRWIIGHLLGSMAGWEAVEVPHREQFDALQGPKLVYGHSRGAGAFQVEPQGLLERTDMASAVPQVGVMHGVPALFPAASGDLPFDCFSAAFFLLSRYEEYGPIARDVHGRPQATALHAAHHGYLHRPVVDEWLYLLHAAWRKADPRLPELQRSYAHTATMDADNGAMYLGRPWWRSLAGAARDLMRGKPQRVLDRMAVLVGSRSDPYAVHTAFLDLAEHAGGQANINFMASPRGPHDHAIGLETPFMKKVVRAAAERTEVGLHPGYASSHMPAHFAHEKKRLEAVLGQPVVRSRQHFLRMRLPDTYRQLEQIGIHEEHSMGLADRSGFRAGTCTPYPFFDLMADAPMALMVHPFMVMDSTLCYKMKLQPQEAVVEACRMVDAVRNVQGRFISVWHERFLSDYGDEQGWGNVAEKVLDHARP